MENIIQSIARLFTSYGFKAAMIIIATIIITNLIKKPIVKYASTYAEKSGYDKSVVTKNITFIPIAVAFILTFCVNLIVAKFNITTLHWGEMLSTAAVYAAVAMATYEATKKQLEAYASRKNVTPVAVADETVEKLEDSSNEEVMEELK